MKYLSTLLLIALGTIACNNQTQPKTESLQAQNIQLVHQLFEHFNSHDWEQMAALYIDSASFKDPSFGVELVRQTHNEIVAKYAELNAIFPDIHDEVVSVYPSGENHVIAEFVSTGTAPDGSKMELPICTIFTIADGKIQKDFNYYDNF